MSYEVQKIIFDTLTNISMKTACFVLKIKPFNLCTAHYSSTILSTKHK